MRYISYIIFHFVMFSALTSVSAQMTNNREGKLDISYGTSGLAVLPNASGRPLTSILDTSGTMIVGYSRPHESIRSIIITKQTREGLVDTSFGVQGIREIGFAGQQVTSVIVTAMAQQADGKLLVAGSKLQIGGADVFIYRLHPSGEIDSSFGVEGQVVLDFRPTGSMGTCEDWISKILVNNDGKIIVTALTEHFPTSVSTIYTALTRLNHNGTIDSTFGTDGFTKIAVGNSPPGFGGLNYEYADASLQSDGKIIHGVTVRREMTTTPGSYMLFSLAMRFLDNGLLDSSFSGDGIVELGSSISFTALKGLPDGKILALYGGTLFKLNADGTRDLEFGDQGRVSFSSPIGIPNALLLMNDNRILVGSTVYQFPGGKALARFVRFWPNGKLDVRFGRGGTSSIEMAQNFRVRTVELADEKRVAATCISNNSSCTARIFITRK